MRVKIKMSGISMRRISNNRSLLLEQEQEGSGSRVRVRDVGSGIQGEGLKLRLDPERKDKKRNVCCHE